jgi:Phosphotransferase enzyme family
MTSGVVSGVELREHPAVRAWRELGHCRPVAVELRKERKKSAVYRLVGAGPRGSTVFAKHCDAVTGEVERLIYEEILPRLEISALCCYGFLPGRDGTCWLFLEDAGEGRFSFEQPEHRTLVARWIAAMHVGATGLPAVQELPDRGSAHYLAGLCEGRSLILRGARSAELVQEERAFLGALATRYEQLAAAWPQLERLWSPLAPTLVHRDFLRSNMRLRDEQDGPAVLVLDWEMAGRGIAPVDVLKVDLGTYIDEVRPVWPLDRDDAVWLTAAAELLRTLGAVEWLLPDLLGPWPSWAVDRLRPHAERLAGAVSALGLERSDP